MSTNDHTTNGWKYGNGSGLVWIDITGYSHNGGIAIEYTPTEMVDTVGYPSFMLYFEKTSTTRAYVTQGNNGVQLNSSSVVSHTAQLNNEYRIEFTGSTLKYYLGTTQLGSANHSLGDTGIKPRIATGANRACRIKDFKIKPL